MKRNPRIRLEVRGCTGVDVSPTVQRRLIDRH